MIELNLEDLGKICGGSSGEEYDRTKICNNGSCKNPVDRIEFYDIGGNYGAPHFYCEWCWFSIKARNANFKEFQRREAKRSHKRKYI